MSNAPIEHVIVLMLENRSFDHMCGYWDRLPSGSGLTGEEFNYVDPTDTSTAKIHGELKLDSSSDCDRFQTGLIFRQQHRPSRTDITYQTGFKEAVEGNAP